MWLKYYSVKVCGVMYYVTCITRCSTLKKHKTVGPKATVCVKIWRFVVLFIAPVFFLYSCLSLEAKTWRRTASVSLSATDKDWVSDRHIYVYVIDQETCGNENIYLQSWVLYWRYRMCVVMCESPVSDFGTGLGTVCNCGYSLNNVCTCYYWHSVSFS